MVEIRPAGEADREAVASLLGFAFNFRRSPEGAELRHMLCAYDGDLPVASARAIAFEQWFGGRRASCAGVATVATLPEYRGRGMASAVLRALLREERAGGRAISVLYPTAPALYRSLGYEFGGVRLQFSAPIADLPTGRGDVRQMEAKDLDQVMKSFSRFASPHNGPVQSPDRDWWRDHVLAPKSDTALPRAVVVPDGEALAGYASYYLEPWGPGGWRQGGYRAVCNHLVFDNPRALQALLGYFRGFENAAQDLAWYGPPSTSPMGLAIGSHGFSVKSELTRWMTRVLDVPLALRSRGYPQVSGEAVIQVDDNLFPENAGPWLVQAEAGRVSVEQVDPATAAQGQGTGKPLPIGLFSALYTGFASPADLVVVGALDEDDERVPFLSGLFAGPVPWMPEFF
ncbi:MAG TPA: GNAT family N-acetyltransferase [Acidimicrobiales bacterium]|nr:GNAT family N-acetyltransferase [Acidimicrobiales bacterium]